jgi:DNA-binding transcriptional MerR regulator
MIGEVSARTGLSVRTIRHYDHTGVVVPFDRSVGGFRLYSDADVRRLELVKTLRPLDLSLDHVRELLESMDQVVRGDGSAEERDPALAKLVEVRALAGRRVELMRGEIAGLERLVRDLQAIERGADVRSPGRH